MPAHSMRCIVAALCAAVLAWCCVGCTPSISKVIAYRETSSASDAKDRYEDLLKYFQADRNPKSPEDQAEWALWRIETLRTLHHLDMWFNFAAAEPEMHARLIELTKAEYEQPKATAEIHQVRAWAVHLLGRANPPLPAVYFVDVLTENSSGRDADYAVRFEALSALNTRTDDLAADKSLRRTVMYLVAQISSDLKQGKIRSDNRNDLLLITDCLQQKLKNYAAVVDLLETSAKDGDVETLMEILEWNYQQMKIGAHTNDAAEFDRNVATLLTLCWHSSDAIRSRARLITAEFAPDALYEKLIRRVGGEGDAAPEDYRQIAILTLKLDADKGAEAAYRKQRGKALKTLFAALPQISPNQREIVYGKLLAGCPADLLAGLTGHNARAAKEREAYALQHLRYMEHLRTSLVATDKTAAATIDTAIAAYVTHPALAVKKQVAASLAERKPILFAEHCVAAIKAIDGEAAAPAEYMVEAYMDTLTRIEAAGLLKKFAATIKPDDPYGILARGIARPEAAVKSKIADFLRTRDCDLLVGMLSADLTRRAKSGVTTDIREWCLLGDIVQEYRNKIKKDSLAAACDAMVLGLSLADTEQALLCARYLLELGCDLAKITGHGIDLDEIADMARSKTPQIETPREETDDSTPPDNGEDE